MSGNKLFSLLVVLFLSFQLAIASEVNLYQGSGPDDICPGSTGLFSDVVENSGDSPIEVSVSSSGTASVFSTTVPQGFVLGPGDIRNIYTYITPSSNTNLGQYVLDISANSESLTHSIFVKDCFDYSLTSLETEKHVCPGESESFLFEITNNGEYAETYELSVEGSYPGQVSLSESVVSVASGSSKNVEVFVSAEESSLGDYDLSLVVDPYTGSVVKSASSTLVVDPCYDFKINTEMDAISFCEHSQEVVSIEVENEGSTSNTFELDLDGPAWANLGNNRLDVAPSSTGNVELVLSPDYGVEGDFEVVFKATPEMGNVEALNVFNVNIKKCHDVTLDVEKNSDTICNSLESNYNVNVVNNGEYDKDYYLELNGPDWADLDQRSVSLGVGEDSQVTLTVNPDYDVVPATYTIEVSSHAKDSSKVASTDKLEITTVTREECYKVVLGLDDTEVELYSDSTATIPVIVENIGSDEATYELSVGGTASSFVYLNPSVITLGESKSELVYLYVAPAEKVNSGEYSVSVSARLEDSTILDSQTVNIVVNEGSEEVVEVTGEVTADLDQELSPFMRFLAFLKGLFTSEPSLEEEVEEVDEIVEEIVDETPEEELFEEVELEETGEEVVEETIEESPEGLMSLGDSVTFNVGDEEHSLSLEDKSANSVLILLESDPVYVALDVGESKEVDLDGDGVNDVLVTFNGFVGDEADITYEVLTTESVEEEVVVEEPTEESLDEGTTEEEVTEEIIEETAEEVVEEETTVDEVLEDITAEVVVDIEEDTYEEQGEGFLSSFISAFGNIFGNLKESVQTYRSQLIILVVLLILVLLSAKTEFLLKVKEFFEEEVEEEPVILEPEIKEEPKEEKKVKKEKPKEIVKEEPEEESEEDFIIEFDEDEEDK